MTADSEFHDYLKWWRLRKETHERRFMRTLIDLRTTLLDMQLVVPIALAFIPQTEGEKFVKDLNKQSALFEELTEVVQDHGLDMLDLLRAVQTILLKQNEPPSS